MQTYWTSGVMIPVDAKPGERVFYAKEEADVRIAELEGLLRRCCEADDGYMLGLGLIDDINRALTASK